MVVFPDLLTTVLLHGDAPVNYTSGQFRMLPSHSGVGSRLTDSPAQQKPGRHGQHRIPFFENVPAGHGVWVTDVDPAAQTNRPRHFPEHAGVDSPVVLPYVPAAHSVATPFVQ